MKEKIILHRKIATSLLNTIFFCLEFGPDRGEFIMVRGNTGEGMALTNKMRRKPYY